MEIVLFSEAVFATSRVGLRRDVKVTIPFKTIRDPGITLRKACVQKNYIGRDRDRDMLRPHST